MSASVTGVLFGLALGVRHALEPDHLAAVSVLATEHPSVGRGALLGALWGIGHTAALVAVALALGALQIRMPPGIDDAFALGVASLTTVLGARSVVGALRRSNDSGTGPGGRTPSIGPARPLLIGTAHGLAGSGTLMALVAASLPSPSARYLFVALFGAGSVVGMALLSGVAGWPLARLGRRPAVARTISLIAGMASAALGLTWGWALAVRLL